MESFPSASDIVSEPSVLQWRFLPAGLGRCGLFLARRLKRLGPQQCRLLERPPRARVARVVHMAPLAGAKLANMERHPCGPAAAAPGDALSEPDLSQALVRPASAIVLGQGTAKLASHARGPLFLMVSRRGRESSARALQRKHSRADTCMSFAPPTQAFLAASQHA